MARRAKNDPDAPELSIDTIVNAAIEVIDNDGLDAFSLRALARHLGAGNMSLYYYVKDRDALLTLVLDEVIGSVSLKRLPNDPLDALATLAKRFVAAFAEHPGTIPLFVLQPIYSVGPRSVAFFDRFVGLLRDVALPDDVIADTTIALIDYLCGHLISRLPQLRHGHEGDGATADDIIGSIPRDAAPNIHALAPALRRAADTSQPAAGIMLILAGVRTHNTPTTPTRSGR
jgi:AcrR family transcriptional regulator